MLYNVSVAFILLYLGLVSFMEGLCYTVSLSLCLKFNAWITTTFVRRLFALFKSLMGLTLIADSGESEMLPERYLVVANHQSFVDILAMLFHLDGPRVKFIARGALGSKLPLVTPMLKTDGHCLVAKEGHTHSDMQAIDEFAQKAEENNWIPVIFPEGECSRDGRVRPFHAAGFRRLLESAPLPVAVFAIDGGWQYSDISEFIRALRHGKGVYRIKLLKVSPPPQGKNEQKRILSEAHDLICAQLEAWRGSKGQE